MKHTLTLAAWNFRLARRYLLALWASSPPSSWRWWSFASAGKALPAWGWRPIITLPCKFLPTPGSTYSPV